jgi:hypothetical protein
MSNHIYLLHRPLSCYIGPLKQWLKMDCKAKVTCEISPCVHRHYYGGRIQNLTAWSCICIKTYSPSHAYPCGASIVPPVFNEGNGRMNNATRWSHYILNPRRLCQYYLSREGYGIMGEASMSL